MNAPAFHPRTGRFVLVAAALATGMAFLDATALVLAMPAIQEEFSADAIQLLWINTAYAIPLTALLLLGGALGDRFDRKLVFMSGILLFAAAALACGFAPDIRWLIALRVVQGAGAALMIPGSLALITTTFTESQRGRAIGAWSGLTVIATLGGPVLGGFLAGAGLWRWIFFLNIPVAAIVLVLLRFCVPQQRIAETAPPPDWAGAFLATLSLGLISFGLLEAPRRGVFSSPVILTLILGAMSFAAFFFRESRARHPLIAPGVFRSRQLRAAAALTLLLYSAWNALLFFLPLNLIQVQSYSPAIAGLAPLPLMLALAFLSRPAGRLADRAGVRLPLAAGSVIAGVGFLLLALPGLTAGPAGFWAAYFPGLLVLGAGLGFCVAPLSTAVMNAMPREDSGLASGINSTLARLAGLAGVAVFGPLVIFAFQSGLPASDLSPESGDFAAAVTFPGEFGSNSMKQRQVASDLEFKLAFVRAFRILCLLSAGLCWTGVLAAAHGFRETGKSRRDRETLAVPLADCKAHKS